MVAIGTYSQDLGFVVGEGEGVYVASLSAVLSGESTAEVVIPKSFVANSSYVASFGDGAVCNLYALDERSDLEGGGRLVAYRVLEGGRVERLGEPRVCVDSDSCFVAATKTQVFVANYCGGGRADSVSGSVVAFGRDPETGALIGEGRRCVPAAEKKVSFPRGDGADPLRQKRSHLHMVLPTDSGLLVPDLGSDVVWRLSSDLADVSVACRLENGDGPRHCALKHGHIFVLNELSCTLKVFDEKSGALLNTADLFGERRKRGETATAAALVVANNAAYCSLRVVEGDGLVIKIPLDHQALPTEGLVETYSTRGKMPRDILLLENDSLLLAANQDSNSIVAFDVNPTTGDLIPRSPIFYAAHTPVCIVHLKTPAATVAK